MLTRPGDAVQVARWSQSLRAAAGSLSRVQGRRCSGRGRRSCQNRPLPAVATLPSRIQEITGLPSRPGDLAAGRAAVTALRWALGSSPDWQLALARTGCHTPAACAVPPATARGHITG